MTVLLAGMPGVSAQQLTGSILSLVPDSSQSGIGGVGGRDRNVATQLERAGF